MARINKADHPKILHAVDVERRKVVDVAAEHGCTPANIYALLGKLRRAQEGGAGHAEPDGPRQPDPPPATDLFAAAAVTHPASAKTVKATAKPPPQAPAVAATPARQDSAKRQGGVGATLARPGFGLVMRTAEGDENLTPFRSLEDLLSAVKPILRAAARSADAIWFSIQPVDLASLDSDAVS